MDPDEKVQPMPMKPLLLAAALAGLPILSGLARQAGAQEDLAAIRAPIDRPHEIGILKGAQDLPAELVLGRRVVTRSGLYLGDVREIDSSGGEPVARLERPVLFGLFSDNKTVPLSLLRPFGLDQLLVIGSRRTLRNHPAWSD